MNKILLFLAFLMIGLSGYTQFCNTGSLLNGGTLTVTNTFQITTATGNGSRLYYTFFAEPGCVYTFETCGLTSMDTYIRIYGGTNPASSPLLFQNDDACGVQSRINFAVTGSGENWTILITRVSGFFPFYNFCNTLNSNIQLRYRKDCTHTNQECFGATQICNDQTFTGNTSNFGDWQELNSSNAGCLGVENQSSWYYFIPTVNGTISMTISPQGSNIDYDFAIWQGGNCANLGAPIRCSYAGTVGNTGLGNGATDLSEGALGNGWVAPLNVTAGVFYVMLIDNFTANSTPFIIDFTFSTSNLLNCTPTPLPINLLSFTVENANNENVLNWVTSSETNNSHFRIEHSFDTKEWKDLGTVKANNSPSMYEYIHTDYRNTDNYYRLIQVDMDGTENYQGTVHINNSKSAPQIIGIYNILGQQVTMEFTGLKIIRYSDGTTKKVY
jgi:hypothetical protein